MNKSLTLSIITILASLLPLNAQKSEEGFFLPGEGPEATYEYKKNDGKLAATYSVTIRDKQGDLNNGTQTMVYHCFKPDGTPYFKEPNEMLMKTNRKDSQTHVVMDEFMKTMKVRDVLPVGDVSSIPTTLTVGENLPDSKMSVKMGKITADITITDKKVLDHKPITTPAGTFDCWLVHEKVLTTVYSHTTVAIADTWYALNVGNVSQTVSDENGKTIATHKLIALK